MTTSTPEKSLPPLPRFSHLSDYEEWATRDWVHTPGSLEAQEHARAKFDEEIHELIAAISDGIPEEIGSEAGDVIWTAAATGSNAGITITESLQSVFPGYFRPQEHITLGAIDEIASNLLAGTDLETVIKYLQNCERVLGKKANLWFKLGGTVNSPERTFADGWLKSNRVDAVNALARTTLLVTYIAHQYAGKTIEAILNENRQKIEQRLSDGKEVTRPPRS